MPRPTALDLTTDAHDWRRVPMAGANQGIDVVPLASHPDDFALLARFPVGFVRDEPGGYHAAETFLVLEGSMEFDGRVVTPGDLTHVPAECLRVRMATEEGCTALAFFSGPATFLAPDELGECRLEISTVRVPGAAPGTLHSTPEAEWTVDEEADGEAVDLRMTRWAFDGQGVTGPVLSRRRR